MATRMSKWDASSYLDTPESILAYLNAALEDGDPALVQAALGDIAKAQGMSLIATKAGVGRESLYKSLSADGNPSFKTISKVIGALGGRIAIEPAKNAAPPAGKI